MEGMEDITALQTEWLDWMETRGYSKSAVQCRRQAIAEFMGWAGERGVERPDDATRPTIEAYQRYLWRRKGRGGRPLAVGTQRQRLGAIRAFFGYLVRHGHLAANPAADLDLPRSSGQRLPNGLTKREVAAALTTPETTSPVGVRDRAILELLYAAGLRRAELCALDVADLDRPGGLVSVQRGKGGKGRVVPVGERALRWLDSYLDEARPKLALKPGESALFLTWKGGRFAPMSLSNLVKKTFNEAGVTGRGSCHRFRHACATHMLEGGADLRVIQQMLGHARAETTAIYASVDIAHLREVYRTSHPAASLPTPDKQNEKS